MFQTLLKKNKDNVNSLRSIIKTHENLRQLLFNNPELIDDNFKKHETFKLLLEDIPIQKEWQIYDQCSVIIRLYAIYEKFVEELIRETR